MSLYWKNKNNFMTTASVRLFKWI